MEQEIIKIYDTFFKKPDSYFNKHKFITLNFTQEEREYWAFKDCPRLFSFLDFKEWVEKYKIKNGKKRKSY